MRTLVQAARFWIVRYLPAGLSDAIGAKRFPSAVPAALMPGEMMRIPLFMVEASEPSGPAAWLKPSIALLSVATKLKRPRVFW